MSKHSKKSAKKSDSSALRKHYPWYLANTAVKGKDAQLVDVLDKYTGKVACKVAKVGEAEVEQAIAAAFDARAAMAALPADARRDVLQHCVKRFRERHDEFAHALCIEAGKPIKDAKGEVDRLIDTFRIAAEEATRPPGEVMNLAISERTRGYRGMVKQVPVGVCSLITPFNFPLNLVAHKVAPAIAAGCPFVLKPAMKTPVGALMIGEVLAETDLPKGAFSILNCSNEAAAKLVQDERIALLSFTGGLIGWDLKAQAGKKKVTLELGGNAACIVDQDAGASLEHIADRIVFGAYYQSGQSCISVQRILVHTSHYDTLKALLKEKVKALVMGDPRKPDTFIGPVIDETSAKRMEGWISDAIAAGASQIAGGKRKANLLPATLLENVPHDADVYRKEVFGPIAMMEPFDDFGQAIATVNDSDFGLQAGVFTGQLAHAMQAWDELHVGGVVVGDVPSFRVDNMPYGGVKDSGLGREGVRWAIADMSEERLLVIKG